MLSDEELLSRIAAEEQAPPPKPRARKNAKNQERKSLSVIEQLRKENAELRERIGLKEPQTMTLWESFGSQEMRDRFAARALMGEWMNPPNALKRLGFAVEAGKWPELAERIFGTEGVKRILDASLHESDENWKRIVARQREIALNGDDETAVRAVQMLAKLERRVDADPAPAVHVSLYQLINKNEPAELQQAQAPVINASDPLQVLTHEPASTGVRITTGEKNIDSTLKALDS